jgi:hypothetical protein
MDQNKGQPLSLQNIVQGSRPRPVDKLLDPSDDVNDSQDPDFDPEDPKAYPPLVPAPQPERRSRIDI